MMIEKETYEICNEVDSFIVSELTESIIHKVSYDMLGLIIAFFQSAGGAFTEDVARHRG